MQPWPGMADAYHPRLSLSTGWLMPLTGLKQTSTRLRRRYLLHPAVFDPSKLIYLRRNLLSLRKSLFHEREILIKISRNDCEWVPEKATVHYRDIL
ncbi:MAG: hypothetical protein MZV63_56845 [Marinilabiliales bacterium]|nr:hypothetical protein [Marinilabiliales bacterium]